MLIMKKFLSSIAAAAALFVAAFFLSQSSSAPTSSRTLPNPSNPTEALKHIGDAKHRALIAELGANVKKAFEQGVPLQTESGTNEYSISIPAVRDAFVAMNKLRTYFDKDRIRNEMADELLRHKDALPLSSRILIDNAFARQQFGEDQAVARVYAIYLLKREAVKGNTEPIRRTTAELSKFLAAKPEISKGERQDLDDLLSAYLENQDKKEVRKNMPQLLGSLAYSKPLSDIYKEVFFFALKDEVPDDEIENFLSRHFG
jgi:hypothetical protein